MLVKGRGMNTTSDRTPVAYLIRLIPNRSLENPIFVVFLVTC